MPRTESTENEAHSMQTELTVIVPTVDNDGHTLQPVIDRWEDYLLDHVGGWSKYPGMGAWREGRDYHDDHYRYIVVSDAARIAEIRNTLPVWCLQFRQEALMNQTRKVTVSFARPAPVPAHS